MWGRHTSKHGHQYMWGDTHQNMKVNICGGDIHKNMEVKICGEKGRHTTVTQYCSVIIHCKVEEHHLKTCM